MKFNPKPGDKIICNNGEEFICCTLETLISKGFGIFFKSKSDSVIFGMKEGYSEWMYWPNGGYPSDFERSIREVIPQNSETSAGKKEEVKEEPRYKAATALRTTLLAEGIQAEQPLYNLQKIKEAWDASGWVSSTMSWNTFKKNLMKNDDDFQEYLRLKAIYE